jgi:hypothetical protein
MAARIRDAFGDRLRTVSGVMAIVGFRVKPPETTFSLGLAQRRHLRRGRHGRVGVHARARAAVVHSERIVESAISCP